MAQIMIYIVDDDPSVLHWIRAVCDSVGLPALAFASAHEFLEAFDASAPGVLITDLRMPRMSGLDLQLRLQEMEVDMPVIVLSAHGEIAPAVRAMKLGAIDFLEKPCNAQDLLDRVNAALSLADVRHRMRARRREISARLESLTDRERETLDGVLAGKANKVIAADLGISEKTVEDRRARVMRKMGADSVAELVRMVVESRPPQVQPAEA